MPGHGTSSKRKILFFTRYPKAGSTKTRLINALGANGAAALQKRLTENIYSQLRLLKNGHNLDHTIHFSGGSGEMMRAWLGQPRCVHQIQGDLGQRMQSAFAHAFHGGTETALIIGSDIPDISAKLLKQAFHSLEGHDVVIGPSRDGGYYLIGFHAEQAEKLFPLLFSGIPWSTGEVYTTTMNRLQSSEFTIFSLPTLRDIDTEDDLPFAREQGLL